MANATNPVLEAAIRHDRTDPAPYLVYADWLQSAGHPLGELIVLQHALDKAPDPAKQARADEIIKGLDLPSPKLATFGWRRGLWSWLRLENQEDWMNEEFDAVALARTLFASPACAVLEELRIGILRWDANAVDVPAVVAEAANHAWAPGLTRLHLGDVASDIDMAHHVVGDVGEIVSRVFPNLVSLKLHSGNQEWRGDGVTFGVAGITLPALVELVVETCSLSSERAQAIAAARTPNLERLELWFGSDNEGADASTADIRGILDGQLFPKLRQLGLRNAEIADELAAALPAARIAARLESLDLSMGTLGDEAAIELAAQGAAFPALRQLSVDDNYLTEEALTALRAGFPRTTIISNSQKEGEEDDRYVSVAE
ncbi:MAG: TIGR02996 domain-containing protein [Myxococcota bacterium]|nr:TIGR02996 domain-containing protein [Myxococcota bacterium]